ncbi:MAG: peptide-methionine (S)-S-oxide reductase MsrA [Myxococcales bacterium]|nr:peptide-methionine (S)-S-oxide reductase MsrA [Myxococcales bacterium]
MDLGVDESTALPGREQRTEITGIHAVLGSGMMLPFAGLEVGIFALGCFWGAERVFWKLDGVRTTAVGYVAGFTQNPSYEEVCSGRTGHAEAVLVGFDPSETSYPALLQTFWRTHDPTQGMRQGNDRGTHYRSGVYTSDETQAADALASCGKYQSELSAAGLGKITTEISPASEFFYAEEYHQQYLHKNPAGYCGIGGTGI